MRMDESVGLKNIGKENVLFTWSKIKTILPAYLTAWVLATVMYIKKVGVVIYEQEGLRQFAVRMVHAIPNLLLLDMSGIKNSGVLGISLVCIGNAFGNVYHISGITQMETQLLLYSISDNRNSTCGIFQCNL